MSDTEREALARLLRAVAAVEKMLPHGPDRYELLVAAQAIAAALAAEREAGWRAGVEAAAQAADERRPPMDADARARAVSYEWLRQSRPIADVHLLDLQTLIAAALREIEEASR